MNRALTIVNKLLEEIKLVSSNSSIDIFVEKNREKKNHMKNYVELVKNSIFLSRNLHKSDVIIL